MRTELKSFHSLPILKLQGISTESPRDEGPERRFKVGKKRRSRVGKKRRSRVGKKIDRTEENRQEGAIMRIDPNHAPQLSESNRSTAPSSAATVPASGSAALGGEDQAQLSGAHAQVQALAAQASQLPEIREGRVQSLRQAVQSGLYQLSPEKTASAVFDHLLAASAA
ncbi:MAG TPA: flagellar biosynthesis anti-sigma factor FlgM [Candidatus Sulfotelmatobacter sp.]